MIKRYIHTYNSYSTDSLYRDETFALQTSSQARTILRQMEDGKLLSGQDYSTSALVSLRQTCADSGAVVKAQTPSGGDAMFRAGVEAAASTAMEAGQGSSLGGASPQRFVSGLANDLGKALPPQPGTFHERPTTFI